VGTVTVWIGKVTPSHLARVGGDAVDVSCIEDVGDCLSGRVPLVRLRLCVTAIATRPVSATATIAEIN